MELYYLPVCNIVAIIDDATKRGLTDGAGDGRRLISLCHNPSLKTLQISPITGIIKYAYKKQPLRFKGTYIKAKVMQAGFNECFVSGRNVS